MSMFHFRINIGRKGYGAKHAEYVLRLGRYAKQKDSEKLLDSGSVNMPIWAAHNPLLFWEASDRFERSNGSAYQEFELALPNELTHEQMIQLALDFAKREGWHQHVYTWGIHTKPGALSGIEQPHVHLMRSLRMIDGIERDPELYFKRFNSKHPELGGCKKASEPVPQSERQASLVRLRKRWADIQNETLARHGCCSRVDHRSLIDQGVQRTPERYLGPIKVERLSLEEKHALAKWRKAGAMLESAKANLDLVVGNVAASLAEELNSIWEDNGAAEEELDYRMSV